MNYDYLIVGAGSAGCVLANRLSENTDNKVAIFEAGGSSDLWKVKMPLAFPEIILGANQTLMFSLFMVMIAGFIGTVDLSQEIFRALSFSDGGKGLIIGLCVAFIGLAADHLIRTWAAGKKEELGL